MSFQTPLNGLDVKANTLASVVEGVQQWQRIPSMGRLLTMSTAARNFSSMFASFADTSDVCRRPAVDGSMAEKTRPVLKRGVVYHTVGNR